MDVRQAVVARVEAYLAASGLSAYEFGIKVANNNKLVARLRTGRGVTTTTIDKIEAFMRSNPPASQDGKAA